MNPHTNLMRRASFPHFIEKLTKISKGVNDTGRGGVAERDNDGVTEDAGVGNNPDGAREGQPTTRHAARNLSFLAQLWSAMGSSCHRAGHPQTAPQRLSHRLPVWTWEQQ